MLSVSWGSAIWTGIAFGIVFFILAKYAWGPILKGIKEREESIDDALKSAEKARLEMSNLQASNEELLRQSRLERDAMLKEAREIKDNIVKEAKAQAVIERDKMIAAANETIGNEKRSAIIEIRAQVATLSLEIAERILRNQLSDDSKQKALVQDMLNETKLN
jgi:F-type H+-transporting ATPase subunit b